LTIGIMLASGANDLTKAKFALRAFKSIIATVGLVIIVGAVSN
jgi:hypothetical protein